MALPDCLSKTQDSANSQEDGVESDACSVSVG